MKNQVINHLKGQDVSFVVAGNCKTHAKKSNGTADVTSNNHKESDTLMRYCLPLIDLENKLYMSSHVILMYLLHWLATMKTNKWFDFINGLV